MSEEREGMLRAEEGSRVLCVANCYKKEFYLNPDFAILPEQIRQELQILCVLFTEEVSGIFALEFDEDGTLQMKTEALENDFFYDEIGAALKIKALQEEKAELFASLELFYQVFLGKDADAMRKLAEQQGEA